jgi:DNA-binding response OmpR family regulator
MKKKKILVIDDDSSIRVLLDHLLNEEYETEVMNNGHDALALMQKGNIPDLIISDLSMPKMDGNNFIDNVKMSHFFKNIPLIILSANSKSAERINCLKKGVDDFLIKPFNPEELKYRVKNMLTRIKTT